MLAIFNVVCVCVCITHLNNYHNEHVSNTVVWLKGFVTKFQIVTYIQSMAKTITLLSGTSSKNTTNRIDYEF